MILAPHVNVLQTYLFTYLLTLDRYFFQQLGNAKNTSGNSRVATQRNALHG